MILYKYFILFLFSLYSKTKMISSLLNSYHTIKMFTKDLTYKKVPNRVIQQFATDMTG